jgi:hypothetical protein
MLHTVLVIAHPLLICIPDPWNVMYVKGKAIPIQAWIAPEGSRRLRLPDLKTVSTLKW